MRIKRGVAANKRRKNVIRRAKGYINGRSKKFRFAKDALRKAGNYAYRDRKAKKRDFRALWILRINAACREKGLSYSEFAHLLRKSDILLNRKMLQQIAVEHPKAFAELITSIKK